MLAACIDLSLVGYDVKIPSFTFHTSLFYLHATGLKYTLLNSSLSTAELKISLSKKRNFLQREYENETLCCSFSFSVMRQQVAERCLISSINTWRSFSLQWRFREIFQDGKLSCYNHKSNMKCKTLNLITATFLLEVTVLLYTPTSLDTLTPFYPTRTR